MTTSLLLRSIWSHFLVWTFVLLALLFPRQLCSSKVRVNYMPCTVATTVHRTVGRWPSCLVAGSQECADRRCAYYVQISVIIELQWGLLLCRKTLTQRAREVAVKLDIAVKGVFVVTISNQWSNCPWVKLGPPYVKRIDCLPQIN